MRVLLVSTYELGHQPVHLASPAAALRAGGHRVDTVDISVETLSEDSIASADAVAVSLPMHTASRLALEVLDRVGRLEPGKPVALYGLYAGVVDAPLPRFAGEYEPGLLAWVDGLASGVEGPTTPSTHIGRSDFRVPDRTGLAPLEQYARLAPSLGEETAHLPLAGAVEASHGCRHRCRHCPIPVVYDGRIRVVPREVVLADIDSLVDRGAAHITFGDPDFLNAPRHTLGVIDEAHRRHPHLTFDITTKVEHILEHREIWPELAEANLLFVISAFETVDETTLEILDKGHDLEDMGEAVRVVRAAGVHIRPTWLPFFPWTEPGHVAGIFRFLDGHDLNGATDPVQLSIRLLIPRGSLLEDHPAVVPHLVGYDPDRLGWEWDFADPMTGMLHEELERIAMEAADCDAESLDTLSSMRRAVEKLTGQSLGPMAVPSRLAPRLTESWFCCAEPTDTQMVSIQIGRDLTPDKEGR